MIHEVKRGLMQALDGVVSARKKLEALEDRIISWVSETQILYGFKEVEAIVAVDSQVSFARSMLQMIDSDIENLEEIERLIRSALNDNDRSSLLAKIEEIEAKLKGITDRIKVMVNGH